MAKFKTNGLREVEKGLTRLTKKAEELSKLREVNMSEVLTSEFLRANTTVGTFDELLEKSGFKVETQADFIAIPEEEFDQYIRSISSFDSWSDMIGQAHEEYIAAQLGF